MFARQGVATYLVVDPIAQQITALTLQDGHFSEVPIHPKLNVGLCKDWDIHIGLNHVFDVFKNVGKG